MGSSNIKGPRLWNTVLDLTEILCKKIAPTLLLQLYFDFTNKIEVKI